MLFAGSLRRSPSRVAATSSTSCLDRKHLCANRHFCFKIQNTISQTHEPHRSKIQKKQKKELNLRRKYHNNRFPQLVVIA